MNLREKRAFARKFGEMVDCESCELSPREKRRLKLSVRMIPGVRDEAISAMQDALNEVRVGGRLSALVGVNIPVSVTAIDWENFDWEAAKDFWVEILKVVIEIIMVFI